MVGQTLILNQFDTWLENKSFPRFLIISGNALSGRYTLVKQLKYKLQAYLIECDLGVESVREAIKNCYKCAGTTIYLFRNADKMSTAAKNALLKITEEPPRQAYFIVTVNQPENMLETLRSRAVNLSMMSYTQSELEDFALKNSIEDPLVKFYAESPGNMIELSRINLAELVDFCNTIIDNIKTVSGVNAFKILNRIKIKADGEGFEPHLFFSTLVKCLYTRAVDGECTPQERLSYCNMILATNKYYREFNLTGVKKDSTLDMWILEMREC